MKKIVTAICRIMRSLVPDTKPGNINEDILIIKKMVEETPIGDPTPVKVPDGLTDGIFEKIIDGSTIIIKNAREYVKITPYELSYGYKSKYDEHSDKHHLEISRTPWQYLDNNSNITPSIVVKFLKRFLHRIQNRNA